MDYIVCKEFFTMKTFKKIILFALVSLMVFSAVACGSSDKEAVDYSGEYIETVGQRASITVTKTDKGYDVWVRWPNSADEVYNWYFSGSFDDKGVMSYTGCEKTIIVFDENGNDTASTTYTDGTGKLVFADNALTWQDDKENAGSNSKFAKE